MLSFSGEVRPTGLADWELSEFQWHYFLYLASQVFRYSRPKLPDQQKTKFTRNLESAVRTMQRVRNWQVADLETLQAGVSHEVALRFRLDTSQLPKPFQVTAIGSSDWNIGTDWVRWTFLPGAPGFR